MAKVTFEFDEAEERDDIRLITERHKMVSALYDLQNLRRSIYKGYFNEGDYIYNKQPDSVEGDIYIKDDYVLRELDNILDNVNYLLT